LMRGVIFSEFGGGWKTAKDRREKQRTGERDARVGWGKGAPDHQPGYSENAAVAGGVGGLAMFFPHLGNCEVETAPRQRGKGH